MPETLQTEYQAFSDMESQQPSVSGTKFFVIVSGKTNNVHNAIVKSLEGVGHFEVSSLESCDYLVVFCPIVSRVGTDIGHALDMTPEDKPVILVVLHHTFNREQVVLESRRQVDRANVLLTVDYLFHDGNLLKCDRNRIAWAEIKRCLGVTEISNLDFFKTWLGNYWKLVALAGFTVVVISLVAVLIHDRVQE